MTGRPAHPLGPPARRAGIGEGAQARKGIRPWLAQLLGDEPQQVATLLQDTVGAGVDSGQRGRPAPMTHMQGRNAGGLLFDVIGGNDVGVPGAGIQAEHVVLDRKGAARPLRLLSCTKAQDRQVAVVSMGGSKTEDPVQESALFKGPHKGGATAIAIQDVQRAEGIIGTRQPAGVIDGDSVRDHVHGGAVIVAAEVQDGVDGHPRPLRRAVVEGPANEPHTDPLAASGAAESEGRIPQPGVVLGHHDQAADVGPEGLDVIGAPPQWMQADDPPIGDGCSRRGPRAVMLRQGFEDGLMVRGFNSDDHHATRSCSHQ